MNIRVVDLDPAMPRSFDAEQALLGAILHNPDALDRVRGLVEPEDFFEEMHGIIFRTMCDRRDQGGTIDTKLVRVALGNTDLGGATLGQYVARLYAEATSISSAPDYAKAIRHAALMRQVLTTAREATHAMSDGTVNDPSAYAAQMIEDLDAVVVATKPDAMKRVSLGTASQLAVAAAEEARRGGVQRGAPYGIPTLDRKTLGMRKGQLIIVAGRPGMGKSTAGVSFAMAAARAGHGAYFVSLEMVAQELGERALAAVCYSPTRQHVTYRAIAEGTPLTDHDIAMLDDARRSMMSLPCEIEQQAGLTVGQILSRARRIKTQWERKGQKFSVLIIDHLGLIRPSKRYAGNRVQELTEITGSLKEGAKEIDVAVVALCQLSREVEKRTDKRPQLSDLRDSGSIEQDADVVMGLYREAYYLDRKEGRTPEEDLRLIETENVLELEILKQRQGPTGRIPLFCNIACNAISELVR